MANKRPFAIDRIAYEKALRREVMAIAVRQKALMKERAISNINLIKFHKNTILLVDGTTSDMLRKRALVTSIINDRVQWEMDGTKLSIVTKAMSKNFKESFIGWFYEFGTGTKFEAPRAGFSLPHPGDPNPHRAFYSGTTIVSRSRNDGDGYWTDMGGNKRKANSNIGGKPLNVFNTPSYKWFERAHVETVEEIKRELEQVPEKVNITKFIKGRNIRLG